MIKDLNVSNLIMIYGATLNERARDIMQAYYDHDMSLAEISEDYGLTRQGIRDILVRNTENLYNLEDKLKLQQRFGEIKKNCERLLEIADNDIKECVNNITEIIDKE